MTPRVALVPVTPTVELNTLAMRRGETATYTFLDQKSNQNGSSSYAAKFAHKRSELIFYHFNWDFIRKKNILPAPGFEPTTFWLSLSCLDLHLSHWSLWHHWYTLGTLEQSLTQLIWSWATAPRAGSSNIVGVQLLLLNPFAPYYYSKGYMCWHSFTLTILALHQGVCGKG